MTAPLALIDELEQSMAHCSMQRRAEMLSEITSLYIRGADRFAENAIDLFDDIITRLAAEIEVSVRAMLAHRLAPLANAPINITRVLASDDDISVAGPILVQSARLDEATLVANARAKSQAHLLAISQRKSLSEKVTDVLIERGSRQVVLSTVQNLGARLSKTGFSLLVERAHDDDLLATSVGSRPDIPHDIFVALLATASELVRAKLIAEHPQFKHEIDSAVTAVVDALSNNAGVQSADYAAAWARVHALSTSGQLCDETIRTLAQDGKLEDSIVAIARVCNVPVEIAEQAIVQDESQTILILAKAASLSWSTVKALLSLRAGQRGHSAAQIEQTMASFDRLNFSTARQITEFYRQRQASTPS